MLENVRPTQQQWRMPSTMIATRIGEICLETIKPNANREALLKELHQLDVVQASRRKQILAPCEFGTFHIRYWCATENKLAGPACWKHGHRIAKQVNVVQSERKIGDER